VRRNPLQVSLYNKLIQEIFPLFLEIKTVFTESCACYLFWEQWLPKQARFSQPKCSILDHYLLPKKHIITMQKIIILRATRFTVYQVSIQNEYLHQLNKLLEMGRKGNYRSSLSYSSLNGAALMLFRILAGGTENINFLMKTQSVHSTVKILTLLYSRITF